MVAAHASPVLLESEAGHMIQHTVAHLFRFATRPPDGRVPLAVADHELFAIETDNAAAQHTDAWEQFTNQALDLAKITALRVLIAVAFLLTCL